MWKFPTQTSLPWNFTSDIDSTFIFVRNPKHEVKLIVKIAYKIYWSVVYFEVVRTFIFNALKNR